MFITILSSLSANSNINVIYGSVSIKLFFLSLAVTFFCFFACLLIFYFMLDIIDATLLGVRILLSSLVGCWVLLWQAHNLLVDELELFEAGFKALLGDI